MDEITKLVTEFRDYVADGLSRQALMVTAEEAHALHGVIDALVAKGEVATEVAIEAAVPKELFERLVAAEAAIANVAAVIKGLSEQLAAIETKISIVGSK